MKTRQVNDKYSKDNFHLIDHFGALSLGTRSILLMGPIYWLIINGIKQTITTTTSKFTFQ